MSDNKETTCPKCGVILDIEIEYICDHEQRIKSLLGDLEWLRNITHNLYHSGAMNDCNTNVCVYMRGVLNSK